ncbi:hypothetical protein ACIOUE_37785 [Streptomyces xanthochromogenes]|uniref:hypothetical protein n=1 Tax=Streptomyces xanthochromogenes TaxID=67384 RepID=UPI003805B648
MTTSTHLTATRTPVSTRIRQHLAALEQTVDPALLAALAADVTELETDAAYLTVERDAAWTYFQQSGVHEALFAAEVDAAFAEGELIAADQRIADLAKQLLFGELESIIPDDEAAVARGNQRLGDWMAGLPESDAPTSDTALTTVAGGEQS